VLEEVDGGYRAIWMAVRRAGVLHWLAANNERLDFVEGDVATLRKTA
jgi:hypothetical protein